MKGALLAFVLAVWRLLSGRRLPAVRLAIVLLTIGTLLFGASAVLSYGDIATENRAVVIADGVILRTGPGESFEARFEQKLDEGAELEVQSTREDWLKVLAGGKYEGWLPATDVARW